MEPMDRLDKNRTPTTRIVIPYHNSNPAIRWGVWLEGETKKWEMNLGLILLQNDVSGHYLPTPEFISGIFLHKSFSGSLRHESKSTSMNTYITVVLIRRKDKCNHDRERKGRFSYCDPVLGWTVFDTNSICPSVKQAIVSILSLFITANYTQ